MASSSGPALVPPEAAVRDILPALRTTTQQREDQADPKLAAIHQRVASASVGALLTSIVTNPLDVVKTRLQAQAHPPPAPPATAAHPAALIFRCQRCGVETVHGTVLFDVVPAAAPPAYRGTLDALSQVARREGVRGLYRGLGPSLAMAVPSTVLYYSLYDTLRARLGEMGVGDALAPLVGGSVSRALAATATAPLELIRTQAQATHAQGVVGLTGGLAELVRAKGWRSLWHGLGAQLWRDVPFSAIYWLGYERLTAAMEQRESEPQTVYMAKSFVSGAGAGMLAALVTTPFDVIKTRRQVGLLADMGRGEETRMMPALQDILRVEGVSGLMRGWLPRVLRIGPACAIMISSYEGGKKFFASHTTAGGRGEEA